MIGQTMSAARRAMLLCSILLLVPHANAIQIQPDDWEGFVERTGGHSILVEEYTATHCASCAETVSYTHLTLPTKRIV